MEVDISGAKVFFYDPDRCTASGRITDQRDTDCQLDRHGADHGNMLLADQRTEGTEYFKKTGGSRMDRGDCG